MLEKLFDRVTRVSLRFKWITIALTVLVLGAGIFAVTQLKQELIPSIEFPQTVILAFNSGADSQVMLEEVTKPLEGLISEIDGVVDVESTTSTGVAFLIARNEFGLDSDAMREAIQTAVDGLTYPPGMETPELLTFSFADLPIAAISVSAEGTSLEELKVLVESEINPELEAIDGVGGVDVSGGQELPTEPPPTEEPTPEPTAAPTATATEEPTPTDEPTPTTEPTETPAVLTEENGADPEPVPLPDMWVQAAAAQGVTLETTADLIPEVVEGIVAIAPQMLDELTPEMLLAMPLEALAALPQDYLAGLEADLQTQLAERLAPPSEVSEIEPVPLPDMWIQAAAAQGLTLETTADLIPEVVEGIVAIAPQMLGELTPEMLLAMPLEALAVLPQDYLGALDEELQTQLAERLAPPSEVSELEPVPLPDMWVQAAAAQGLTLETTADLIPEVVEGIVAIAPQMLDELTPEMLLAMPLEALAVLPQDYLAGLEADLQTQLAERLAASTEMEEPEPEVEVDPRELPSVWQSAGDTQNITLVYPEDVTPEIVSGIAELAPQLFDLLTPIHLRDFSPEVLGWLPVDYIAGLEPELQAELDELANSVGGLGALALAAQAEAEALAVEAPELTGAWRQPPPEGTAVAFPAFETAADLLTSGFASSAAELLNLLVANAGDLAPDLLADLTLEVIDWLVENESDFLKNLNSGTLRLLSPEVLAELPDDFLASLDQELRTELEGIAAGTVEVFIPVNTINRVNGNPSLNLSVFQDQEANTVSVSHEVFDKLDELKAANPGLRFDIVFEQASFIEESISGVTREGSLGAVFAMVIILIFLSGRVNGRFKLSIRSMLVTAISIPLSIFMAFALFQWLPPLVHPLFSPLVEATKNVPVLGSLFVGLQNLFPLGLTLNIMTLSGMTVAVGRVVDDSVVVLENIYRHIQRGEDQRTSVLVGTRDVSIAIFASTLTTVVVFLPIGLIGGLVGEFFLPFGIAVTYALGSSFLVAITIVPLMAYLFIRKEHLPPEGENALQRRYTPILEWALKNRAVTLAIATVFLGGSLFLFATRPRAFLPDFGEVQVNISIDLPGDVKMVETDALVAEFERSLTSIEGVETVQTEIGTAGGLQAQFLGNTIDQSLAAVNIGVEVVEDVDAFTAQIRSSAEAVFGSENVTVASGTLSSGAFGGFALVAVGDSDRVAAFNDQAISTLNAVDGLANVSSNLADQETILRINGQPAVRYTGELETENTLGVTEAAKTALEEAAPPGVDIAEGFESQQQTEGFQKAVQALGISVVVVYVVLVVTFGSIVHPFTILFSLPLAIIGAAVALWLSNSILGISSLVGMMMLVGIVVTNAIVLIDRVQANRKIRGLEPYDALVEAGRTRLRPILMTAFAAILALVPLAIGLSEGAIIAAELAIVVIGGLTTSTLLTLLIVPVMYSILDRFTRFTRQN
jgi:HAE1 family hydrophobic/amphiphilic exporter-1